MRVLVVDAQATAAFPHGALLEVGWASWSGREPDALTAREVTARLVTPPPGARLPAAVRRLTGLERAEWARGEPPEAVWGSLSAEAARLSPSPVPAVVHFARFEEPLLRALHARHGRGPFPLRLVCTHAIACRLLPELPRRTLRALAGYFGAGVRPLRRSAEHVAATALVWRHLVALLADREGIVKLDALEAWLSEPARRRPRTWPLARERRLDLPTGPGVYRLLRVGGGVLYVGKATSLRQRVSGHFHGRGGERSLEMLTQARDVAFTETATVLEAALLEADEIKRRAPPYNVALGASGRAVFFATTRLDHLQDHPDGAHPVGPLGASAPFEALAAFRALRAASRPPSLALRARALGIEPAWAPGREEFAAGLAAFVAAHGTVTEPRALLRLGARLWTERHEARATDEGDGVVPLPPPAWSAERVRHGLEETVARAAHGVRRARWLVRISECALSWGPPGARTRRLLVIERARVAASGFLEPGSAVPVPPGHARSVAERRSAFDVAAYDRLRVLTTELRGLVHGEGPLELRLGRHARLSRRRLRVVLRGV